MASTINLDEYSESETIIKFPNPIPLLRHPTPSNPPTLAFRNLNAFKSAHTSSHNNIFHQCYSASRIACSVTASNSCSPPWWRTLLPNNSHVSNNKEREECEEREMMSCMEVARDNCRKFASEKCWNAFKDARVVAGESDDDLKKRVVEVIDGVCFGGNGLGGKLCVGVSVVRGSELLEKRV